MQFDLAILTHASSGRPVAVNPIRVKYFDEQAGYTNMYFDDQAILQVKEDFPTVHKALRDAIK